MSYSSKERDMINIFIKVLIIDLVLFVLFTYLTSMFYINFTAGMILIIYSIAIMFTIIYFMYVLLEI